MAVYDLLLDSNMVKLWNHDLIVTFAVGDSKTIIRAKLGNGFLTTDASQYERIEFRATAPDGQSVIETENIELDKKDKSVFICTLPTNISKGSGDITDARFRLINGDEVESTSQFKMRIVSTPGMVEVNGDHFDRLNEMIIQAEASANTINDLTKSAEKQIKESTDNATKEVKANAEAVNNTLKKASADVTAQINEITTAKNNFIQARDKLIQDFNESVDNNWTAKSAELDKKFKEKLDALDSAFATKIQGMQSTFTDKLNEWQGIIDKLDLTGVVADIEAIKNKLESIKTEIANIDLAGMKTALDKGLAQINTMQTAVNGKADKSDLNAKADKTELASKADKTALDNKADKSTTYTKTEVDSKLKDAGKVKTVNGKQPDANGNIAIDVPQVDTKDFAKKVNDEPITFNEGTTRVVKQSMNLDSFDKQGMFFMMFPTSSSTPKKTTQSFYLIAQGNKDGGQIQNAYYPTDGAFYIRSSPEGARWTAWQQIATSSQLTNFATKSDVSTAETNAKNAAQALFNGVQKIKGITKSDYDRLNPGNDGVIYMVTED